MNNILFIQFLRYSLKSVSKLNSSLIQIHIYFTIEIIREKLAVSRGNLLYGYARKYTHAHFRNID